MNRDEIGDTMYNLGRFFPDYEYFLKSITDSPFQEEIRNRSILKHPHMLRLCSSKRTRP